MESGSWSDYLHYRHHALKKHFYGIANHRVHSLRGQSGNEIDELLKNYMDVRIYGLRFVISTASIRFSAGTFIMLEEA